MRFYGLLSVIAALLLGAVALKVHGESIEENWPAWRGPNANGAVADGNPPITWSESENIKWKVELPFSGDCTPAIWGNKIFVQTAVPQNGDKIPETVASGSGDESKNSMGVYTFNLVCLDRETGNRIWQRTVAEEVPHQGHHPHASLSSYSPVTDGSLVWANFGSRGVHCFDLEGNPVWSADTVRMQIEKGFGEGSSPALADDALIVVADHEGDSKIYAFDKKTGDVLWQKDREEACTWATPLPVKVGDSTQVVTNGLSFIRSYDVKTGDIVWQCAGLTIDVIPSPVAGYNKVFCLSGFEDFALLAINLGHTGDLTGTEAIAWQLDKGTPQVASPLLYGENIYFFKGVSAILSSYKADSGKPLFVEARLKGLKNVYASPVGAADRVYITDRSGTTMVINYSDTLEIIATNSLDDEGFDASPVIIGDELYLKGDHYLYCIANQ